MLTNALKSTSALALCAAMMAPPAVGQSSQGEAGAELELCGVMGPFPCKLEDGTVIEDATELAREKLSGGDDQEPAADTPAADTPPAADPAPDGSGEAQPPAEDDTSIIENVIEEAGEAVDDLLGTAPEDGDPAEADPEPEAAPDAPAETPAAGENSAEEAAGEVPAEEPGDDPAVEEDPAPDQPSSDEQPPAAPVTDDGAAGEATAPEPRPEATGAAPDEVPEAAAAAAAGAEGGAGDDPEAGMEAGGDVTVEEVTEEEARSSGEEFDTAVGAENRAPEARGGMSDFERALLIGLGAVAVGTILYNGAKIVANSGDRIVVRRPDGTLEVLKNDDEILRRPGSEVRTQTYEDGSTRTVVTRPDGTRIITIRAADGTALQRIRVLPDGSRHVLFDDTEAAPPVDRDRVAAGDRQPARETLSAEDEDALRAALIASMNAGPERRYSLRQIRQFAEVRDLAPMIEVDAITFDTGSAVIRPGQAEQLAGLGIAIREVIEEVPGAVFLIEGHTDAVGDASYNLALSDRRAESVALALTEYFDVPPENLVTQGYGESELKIVTAEAERRNRRANVRNITPLLR